MKIETKRLILRPLKDSDAEDIRNNINNLKVSKWLLVVPYPYSLKDAKEWVSKNKKDWRKKEKTNYNFGIELKKEEKIIGCIGLHSVDTFQGTAGVGYWIGEKYWRNGYGGEALNELLKFVFKKLKLRRIEAGIFEGNPSSGRLLEKFGAKKEGFCRKSHRCKADKKILSEIKYGLLKEDWRKLK